MHALFHAITPLQQSLDYHLGRHNILVSNIAHVDTPGFRPSDLERVNAADFKAVLSVALQGTHPSHVSEAGPAPELGRVFQDLTAGGGADGNFVSLEREAGKMASNQLRYDVVTMLASGSLKALMYAASDGAG